MDTSCRKLDKIKWLLIAFLVVALLHLSGCASSPDVGGAGTHVDDKCNGLDEIGYKPPFSSQDIKDIEALGFDRCAQYIRTLQ